MTAVIELALERRGRLPLAAMARTLGFSRAEFYRLERADRDVELRDAIHAIALDWPRYGYRTISRSHPHGKRSFLNTPRLAESSRRLKLCKVRLNAAEP